jgi:lipopolysaccharide transport system permease protein
MRFTDLKFFLLQLKSSRNLLRNLVIRDLKNRYVGSVGGFFWSVVQPVALLVCYYFVFAVVLGIRFDLADYGTENFALYLFSGMVPWLMFSDTVLRNCTAVTDNVSLVTKTAIPSEVLPIAIMISNLIHHLIGLAILIVALIVFESVHLGAFWVLAYLLPLTLLSQGLGWLVSSLNVFVRDTIQVLNVSMVFWLWLTPVFYPASLVPPNLRLLVLLNPMTAIVTGYRSAIFASPPPSIEQVLVLLAWTVAAFFGGALFFRRSKAAFADVL